MTSKPAAGVRNPSTNRMPLAMQAMPINEAPDSIQCTPRSMAQPPTASRRRSKPTPGAPAGKVENNGSRPSLPTSQTRRWKRNPNPQIVWFYRLLSCCSQLDDSAAHRDSNCLRAIAGAELLHNVPNMTLDGIF